MLVLATLWYSTTTTTNFVENTIMKQLKLLGGEWLALLAKLTTKSQLNNAHDCHHSTLIILLHRGVYNQNILNKLSGLQASFWMWNRILSGQKLSKVVKSCHICFKWVKIDHPCKGVLSQNDDFSTKNNNIQVHIWIP